MIDLGDGDQIALEISTPEKWLSHHPTIVLVHGLCGSHRSHNMIRIARKFYEKGMRVVRLNLRGCGSGRGRARQIYHSGSSPDVRRALEILNRDYPESPITLIGYSLGGNIVLKLAGEMKEKRLIQHVIAISPPADLAASSRMLGLFKNQIYERYFIALLISDINYRRRRFTDLPAVKLPLTVSMFEFDEHFLAPSIGYKNAAEYYAACSAKNYVKDIQIPCHILFAKDDPIIDPDSLDKVELPSIIRIVQTKRGGQLGFIGHPESGFRWMDRILGRWVDMFHKKFYASRVPIQNYEMTGTEE